VSGVWERLKEGFWAADPLDYPVAKGDGDRLVGEVGWGHRRTWRGRAGSMVWLAIVAAPLSATFAEPHLGAFHLAVVLAVAAAFASTIFAMGVVPDDWEAGLPLRVRLVPVLGCLGALSFLSFYDGPTWAYMFTLSIFPIASVFRRPWPSLIGLGVLTAVTSIGSQGNLGDCIGPLATVLGVGVSFLAFRRLTEANQALREAREDLARVAVAEERLRFARDIHDLLGHSLSVITLKSEVAGRLLATSPERAAKEVAEIEAVAREALREVRDAVTGYRQATLGVEMAAARTALAAAGIAWNEEVAPLDVPAGVEGPLAWALREGVTNVIRHSHARTCHITVARSDAWAQVTVVDDGPGDATNGRSTGQEVGSGFGNGLRGLSERLGLAGGTLEAGPVAGGGYRLCAAVPRDQGQAFPCREVMSPQPASDVLPVPPAHATTAPPPAVNAAAGLAAGTGAAASRRRS
jgi:two-component system, NarL family, sensor histidine kinase DesK